ncbi:MAG: hypothetical protein K8J08_21155 [Thermoanaerobaculia bacterium]|nr:hypothetical protein [Thermoanaerobaculia bacterium]
MQRFPGGARGLPWGHRRSGAPAVDDGERLARPLDRDYIGEVEITSEGGIFATFRPE